MNIEKIIRKWRVMFALTLMLWSIFQLKPWEGSLNVEWGFDIEGGSRIVLKPTNQSVNLDDVLSVLQNRLNIYGLRDVKVRSASDLTTSFVVVEAAGLSREEIETLLANEGHFEGRINNITIFTSEDVTVNTAQILLQKYPSGGYQYSIPIILSPTASSTFAKVTQGLFPTVSGGQYLSADLELYIDDTLQNSLQISSDLRGRDVPSASVSGGAETKEDAENSLNAMKAVLMTGSIPTKMEIVSLQSVSPLLGSEFLRSTALAGVVALLLVGVVLFIRYRNLDIVMLITFTSICEVFITLALASFVNWQLDLSAIAGIIITLGTGVDQQIIITDELLAGKTKGTSSKSKIRDAMFVIMATFGTMAAVMLPLMFIGVGAIRGFAVTTLFGIVVGYFVTRPSYMAALEETL